MQRSSPQGEKGPGNKKTPTSVQLDRARGYIEEMKTKWRFSKTMPQWPHEYVVREWGNSEAFDFFAALTKECGYEDRWGSRSDSYLVIGDFKYWVIEDVLNRAEPISNAEVRRRGLIWLQANGKIVGPYGRPVDATKGVAGKRK